MFCFVLHVGMVENVLPSNLCPGAGCVSLTRGKLKIQSEFFESLFVNLKICFHKYFLH